MLPEGLLGVHIQIIFVFRFLCSLKLIQYQSENQMLTKTLINDNIVDRCAYFIHSVCRRHDHNAVSAGCTGGSYK